MKYTIEQIPKGEDELILRYQRLNSEAKAVHKSLLRLFNFIWLQDFKKT